MTLIFHAACSEIREIRENLFLCLSEEINKRGMIHPSVITFLTLLSLDQRNSKRNKLLLIDVFKKLSIKAQTM